MNVIYYLFLVLYFTVVALICCLPAIFILLRAAVTYRAGTLSRAHYVLRALLLLTAWAALSVTAFYIPFFDRTSGTGWLLSILLMTGSARWEENTPGRP